MSILIGEDFAFIGMGIVVATSLLFIPFWRDERLKRAQRELLAERRCFVCGYPLKGNGGDDQGWSSCPECGRRFNHGEYMRPGVGYERQFDDEAWIQHLEPTAATEMRERLAGELEKDR